MEYLVNYTTGSIRIINGVTAETIAGYVLSQGWSLDDNYNIFSNNYFPNATSTVSSAGTTVLTAGSSRIQRITGSTTHTFQLPNATTLPTTSIFEFDNGSSGSVTINNAGWSAQYTLSSGGDILVKCTDNTTSNGVWDFHALAPSIVSWSSGVSGLQMNNALNTTPLIQSGASSATAPSFIPQRTASTTWFGWNWTSLSATVSGTERLNINSSGITVTGSIDLGNTDTTLSRVWAGIISIEWEVINWFTTTATAAGTTTLTIASAVVQAFTGTTTQTVRLPTTSVLIGQTYVICNLSTGLVTIQSSGANTITTLGQNQRAIFRALVSTPTTAANWVYTETNMNANSSGKRVVVTTQSATPAINTNNGDIFQITGLAQAITSMSSSLTGNPLAWDMMMIQITDNGTARAITWWASFASTTTVLPTTTVVSTMLRVLLQRNNANTVWDCISVT